MFCPKCGAKNIDGVKYCYSCGAELPNSENNNGYNNINSELQDFYNTSVNPKKKTNGFAIAGFVCSFFIPILGWIFGGIGLSKVKSCGGSGKGLAISALIIATIGFIFNLIQNINDMLEMMTRFF